MAVLPAAASVSQDKGQGSKNTNTASTMPPGMIMGPDGKPCKICTSFRNWKPRTTNQDDSNEDRAPKKWPATAATATASGLTGVALTGNSATIGDTPTSATDNTNASHDAPSYRGDEPPPGCPPDVEQLGRATWTFLHTTAAYYPEKPSPTQRANMLMLLRSIPVVYPCTWCAKDFGENIEKSPPDVSGRTALSLWLCKRHNEVNKKLGKDEYDCRKVDERWKDGTPDGRCD